MADENEKKANAEISKNTTHDVKKTKRYTPEDRNRLLEKYKAFRKAGDSVKDASRKVGVPYITLHIWEKKDKKEKGNKEKEKSKKTESKKKNTAGRVKTNTSNKKPHSGQNIKSGAKSNSEGLTLVTPKGYRIEGISPSDLIKVLKALS